MIVSQPVVEAAPAIAAGPAAVATAAPVTQSQYHAQDELGQYNFGYADPNSARVETKTADGVVRGSYNYVDTNGQIQTVQYIADALGFRVAATNIPRHEAMMQPQVAYSYLPYAVNHQYYY